jgi:hypothetical protein
MKQKSSKRIQHFTVKQGDTRTHKPSVEISGHMWNGEDIVPFGPGIPPVEWKGKPLAACQISVGSISELEYSTAAPSKWVPGKALVFSNGRKSKAQ